MTVGVVDYGLGNLRSVAGAVERLGQEVVVTSDVGELERAERLILPGVGAFGDGMANLRRLGLVEPLTSLVEQGKPMLGICLGAQLMAEGSDEFGTHEGLGWIPGVVRRIRPIDPSLRVPHVGWNLVRKTGESTLLAGIDEGAYFYFVHSYHLVCADRSLVKGECDYAEGIAAVIERGNVFGTQFHPEKSQLSGLTLLGNFLNAC